MRLMAPGSRPRGDVPTSSMADIAFLLLVFFLVTTVFPKDRGLAVVLPRTEDVVDVPPANLLQLLVLEDGRVEVRPGDLSRGVTVPASRVAPIWREAAGLNSLLVAVVRTHPRASYDAMIDVLDGLKQAGASRVSLQLWEEPGT